MNETASSGPGDRRSHARDRLAAFDKRVGPFYAILGFIFLIVVVIDLSGLPLTHWEQRWIRISEFVIYGAFIVEFLFRLGLAERKGVFLRRNWAAVLALALPMLRPLVVIRAIPAVASGQTLAGLAITHRGFAALRQITRGQQLVYVVSLTTAVVLLAAGFTFYLEHEAPGTPLKSFGESLWWAATLATTINSNDDPITVSGRIVALMLRIYAVSVFGYITAFIATWLIGEQRLPLATTSATAADPAESSPPVPAED